METFVKEELITPKKAEALLSGNTKNRNPNKKIIEHYAQMMANGDWKRNTFELIKVGKNGTLLDGQHRLMAVVESKTPIYFHVAYNVQEEIFDVLDTGKKRNPNDVFHIQGIKNANIIPSIIKKHVLLLNGKNSRNLKIMSNSEILDYYNSRPDFYQKVARETANNYVKYMKLLTPQMMGGFIAYIADCYDMDVSLDFIKDLVNGNNEKTNAINLLTKKLIDTKLSKTHNMSEPLKTAYFLKTFIYWLEKKDIKILKFNLGVDNYPFLKHSLS